MIKGADLDNRMEDGAERFHGRRGKPETPEAKGPSLPERIESAKGLTAGLADCRACYHLGRDLVVDLLNSEWDARPLAERLAEARCLRTPHEHGGDPAFAHGRDAAIRVIAGEG